MIVPDLHEAEAPVGLVAKHFPLRNYCIVLQSLHSHGGNLESVDGGMVTILVSHCLKQGRHLVRECNQKQS